MTPETSQTIEEASSGESLSKAINLEKTKKDLANLQKEAELAKKGEIVYEDVHPFIEKYKSSYEETKKALNAMVDKFNANIDNFKDADYTTYDQNIKAITEEFNELAKPADLDAEYKENLPSNAETSEAQKLEGVMNAIIEKEEKDDKANRTLIFTIKEFASGGDEKTLVNRVFDTLESYQNGFKELSAKEQVAQGKEYIHNVRMYILTMKGLIHSVITPQTTNSLSASAIPEALTPDTWQQFGQQSFNNIKKALDSNSVDIDWATAWDSADDKAQGRKAVLKKLNDALTTVPKNASPDDRDAYTAYAQSTWAFAFGEAYNGTDENLRDLEKKEIEAIQIPSFKQWKKASNDPVDETTTARPHTNQKDISAWVNPTRWF